jgi:hypothetical protein
MEKKTYYVTLRTGLSSGEVRDDNFFERDSGYDFAIEATAEEAQQLQELFTKGVAEDFTSYLHAHIPYFLGIGQEDNENYDRTLNEIYKQIYKLGTLKTKHQIEEMGIFNEQ